VVSPTKASIGYEGPSVTTAANGEQLGEKRHATVILRLLLDRRGALVQGELVDVEATVLARFIGWRGMIEALERWVKAQQLSGGDGAQ
jgi:hypothetical protein